MSNLKLEAVGHMDGVHADFKQRPVDKRFDNVLEYEEVEDIAELQAQLSQQTEQIKPQRRKIRILRQGP